MKLLLLIVTFSITALSCATKKSADNSESSANKDESAETITIKASTGQFAKKSDPIISINNVRVQENIMYIDLSYGGGCKQHEFNVIGNLAISKSYPPIRSLQLVHIANDDMCRSIQQVKLAVELDEVAYKKEDGSEIYYILEGWDEKIYHKYQEK